MHISVFLSKQHRSCDNRFALAEAAIQHNDWEAATTDLTQFIHNTLEHFRIEEEVLFPELEQALGQSQGPTQVMRLEHADMRQLLQDLQSAFAQRNKTDFQGISDTLMILLQQHNAKEEQILYPMADRLLEQQTPSLIARCQPDGPNS
jgi:hemerythrin-like domain-containing protein